jgi:hypothetical protein
LGLSRKCHGSVTSGTVGNGIRTLAGLRWWSRYESLWANVTLFDRAALILRTRDVRALTVDDPVVVEAADFFAMRLV